jgi:hypothetical protein
MVFSNLHQIPVGKAADVNALCAEAMAIGPEHHGEGQSLLERRGTTFAAG